jgi:hypothetical protein
MSGEHGIALLALLYLPVAVVAILALVETAARSGWGPALRMRRAYLATPSAVQLAALGILVSAVVHLALVPSHLAEDPVLGVLFALDGIALLAVTVWSCTRPMPGWRPAAIALLVAGIAAYLGTVVTGAESIDAVGVATKAVEIAAIGLLAVPHRPPRHLGGQIR